ncbi:MAG: conserved hypothetical protein partial [Methanobrevibacter sp. CfCl-M3]
MVSTSGGSSVSGCNFTNTKTNGYGGGVYVFSTNGGSSVNGCNFTNNTALGGGGVDISGVNCSVSGCSFTNNTASMNGGGIYINNNGSVVFNRFVNNTDNGTMVGNGVTCTDFCNVSSNWYGNNTPQNITNGVMKDYYQVELSANQVFTRDLNKSASGIIPVLLGYKMCLNGSNNTGNIANLPDFNATIKLNNITGLFRSDIALFRFSPFMMPGESVNVSAKNHWNDIINNHGNYTFSALADNQQLNLNITAERMNTSLSLIAANITYGDNINITATLTSGNGTRLTNKSIIFREFLLT